MLLSKPSICAWSPARKTQQTQDWRWPIIYSTSAVGYINTIQCHEKGGLNWLNVGIWQLDLQRRVADFLLLSMFGCLALWENTSGVLYMFYKCLPNMFEHDNRAAAYLEVCLGVPRLHNLNGEKPISNFSRSFVTRQGVEVPVKLKYKCKLAMGGSRVLVNHISGNQAEYRIERNTGLVQT